MSAAAAAIPLLTALSAGLASARPPPEIRKVDPPSWWVGHSLNPLRLMIRGRGLAGARLQSPDPELEVSRASVSASGTTLFADVHIAATAKPGPRALRVVTAAGAAVARLDLLEPLSRSGRFQGFSADEVIYLIMPDRFADGDVSNDEPPASRGQPRSYHGGDLQGIVDRLPYLKDLGVTALWLTPVYDNASADYHGYGAVDFYAVEEHFGDLGKLRELVDVAHRLGLKVIQDQVANHTGPSHPWVSDPPTPTWYNGSPTRHLANTWQTWTLMDPHASPALRRETLEGWFAGILPDLNQEDEEASRYLIQNTLWWVGRTGLDGIRQDTLPYVPRGFWREWTAALKREYPSLTVVGEMWDTDPALVSFYQGGLARFDGIDTGIDTLFDFPLEGAIRRVFARGEPIRELPAVLSRDHLYPNPGMLVTFLGNHDVPRFMNEPGATTAGLKLALTFLLTARGIPLLYYGDEIAMPGGGDPDNRRDFPGGWPGDARDGFQASGRAPEEQAVFDHLRRLLRLRMELSSLRRGLMLSLAVTEQSYAFARVSDGGTAVVVLNNGTIPAELTFEAGPAHLREGAMLRERLGGGPAVRVANGRIKATLPARTALLYTPEEANR